MPILGLAFADKVAFLHALHEHRGPAGELIVETRAALRVGAEVMLEVRWPGLPNRVYVRAEARRRWLTGQLALRLAADEREQLAFLVRVAHGTGGIDYRRRHGRYRVRHPIDWRRFGTLALRSAVADDLSAGGVLIATRDRAPGAAVGDAVVVRLLAAGDLVLTGSITHAADHQLGVRFDHRGSGQHRALRRWLRTIHGRGVVPDWRAATRTGADGTMSTA